MGSSMSTGELRNGLRSLLRDAGVSLQDPDQLLAMTSVGLTASLWRNSPMEDRHATPTGPGDGDMLRLNVWMTKRMRYALATVGIDHASLEAAATEDSPTPIGEGLHEVVGPELDAYRRHVAATLDAAAAAAPDDEFFVLRFATPIWGFPDGWWGTPWWPECAEAWWSAIEDPSHELWLRPGNEAQHDHRPATLTSDRLRHVLIHGPDLMTSDEAAWFVARTTYTGVDRAAREVWRARQKPAPVDRLALWKPAWPGTDDWCLCGSRLKHESCHGQ